MNTMRCVRGDVPFEQTIGPCPDARPGDMMTCAVLHYAMRCPQCGGAVWA